MYETLTPKELCKSFGTDEKNGLSEAEAGHRLQKDGGNVLKKEQTHMGYDTGADKRPHDFHSFYCSFHFHIAERVQ